MDSNQFNLEDDEQLNQSSSDAYRLRNLEEARQQEALRQQEDSDAATQEAVSYTHLRAHET